LFFKPSRVSLRLAAEGYAKFSHAGTQGAGVQAQEVGSAAGSFHPSLCYGHHTFDVTIVGVVQFERKKGDRPLFSFYSSIRALFLTHFHSDHITEMGELTMCLMVKLSSARTKPASNSNPRTKGLFQISPTLKPFSPSSFALQGSIQNVEEKRCLNKHSISSTPAVASVIKSDRKNEREALGVAQQNGGMIQDQAG
jgi:mRNA degradation ribonuclease J1/J2